MRKIVIFIIAVMILLCIYIVFMHQNRNIDKIIRFANMNYPRVCADVQIAGNNLNISGGNASSKYNNETFNVKDYIFSNNFSDNNSNYAISDKKIYDKITGLPIKAEKINIENTSEIYELDYDMGTPVIVIVDKYNNKNPIQVLYKTENSFLNVSLEIPEKVKTYNLVFAQKVGLYEMSFIFTKGNDVYVVSYLAMDNYMRIIKHFKTQCSNPSFAYNTDKFHKNISIFIVGGLKEEKDIKCVPNLNLNNENACNSIEVLIFQQ